MGAFCVYWISTRAPQFEYLGWGEQGAVYRYELIAESDEVLLDQKALPNRAPFVDASAGAACGNWRRICCRDVFDTSAVQDVDTLASYQVNPQKKFSYHAAEIALAARASYRAMNGALMLAAGGSGDLLRSTRAIENFSPMGLKLVSPKDAGERRDGDRTG